jgi:hypothetical protein
VSVSHVRTVDIGNEAETAMGPFGFDDSSASIRLKMVRRFYPRTAKGVAEHGRKVRNVVGRVGDTRSSVYRSGGVQSGAAYSLMTAA